MASRVSFTCEPLVPVHVLVPLVELNVAPERALKVRPRLVAQAMPALRCVEVLKRRKALAPGAEEVLQVLAQVLEERDPLPWGVPVVLRGVGLLPLEQHTPDPVLGVAHLRHDSLVMLVGSVAHGKREVVRAGRSDVDVPRRPGGVAHRRAESVYWVSQHNELITPQSNRVSFVPVVAQEATGALRVNQLAERRAGVLGDVDEVDVLYCHGDTRLSESLEGGSSETLSPLRPSSALPKPSSLS
mmetsp:Transcript_31592/g.80440  ORF Transcript_31592/g.80440 Transcript_31592/m.80440 type:complete len:243 (+) Transcript_31592:150-878(+)